jgi:hypothetical protein
MTTNLDITVLVKETKALLEQGWTLDVIQEATKCALREYQENRIMEEARSLLGGGARNSLGGSQ